MQPTALLPLLWQQRWHRVKSCLLHCCLSRSTPEVSVTFLHITHKPHHWPQTWVHVWKANEMPIPMLYYPYGNILNFSRTSRIHFCVKNRPTPLKPMMQKLPVTPFPLWAPELSSNTRMPKSTPLAIPNGIWIHSAVLPQYTFRTDRQTDRPTDHTDRRWATVAIPIESDALITQLTRSWHIV